MNTFNRFAAILGFALVSAQAQAVTFDFTSAAGSTYTDLVTGLTVTASAWADTAQGSKFEAATLTVAADGLGVCNINQTGCAADKNMRSLDNDKAKELILFRFSSTVNLQSLDILQIGGFGADLSVWAGTGTTFSPAGQKPNQIVTNFPGTASGSYANGLSVNDVRIVTPLIAGSYDWLAVAASTTNRDRLSDLLKLQALTVTPVAQPVPDAASWMTMLAGLGLVGFAVNRRTKT